MPYFGIPIRNGLPIGLGSVAGFGISPFDPSQLFSAGEQGAWYDPSDYSTLFTDSAGTTPVTGVEQFVGLMLDKSGNGNHAFQTSSAKRPKLAARYNLLTYSEEFDNPAWTRTGFRAFGSGSVANATAAPDGTVTADLVVEDTSSARHDAERNITSTANFQLTAVCYFKKYAAGTATRWGVLNVISAATINDWFGVVVDLDSGAITQQANGSGGTIVGIPTSQNVGNGWWRVTVTGSVAGTNAIYKAQISNSATPTRSDFGNVFYTGDNGSGLYLWGADLRPASQATGLIGPTYQRVAAATVYDTAGFLPYLAFNGLSWSMGTNSIDPGAVDKAQVFAGVRKLSDAAQGAVAEFSATIASNNGTFLLAAPDGATQTYGFDSKGTAQVDAVASSLAAPRTNVVTGLADIAGDSCVIRVNGAVADTETGDQGTGNFLTYPLFIGGRNNASLFFNGWLSALIVRFGANLSQSQIDSTESYVNQKTGAF